MDGGAGAEASRADDGSHPCSPPAPPDIRIELKPLSISGDLRQLKPAPTRQTRKRSQTRVYLDGCEVQDVATIIGPRVPGVTALGILRTKGGLVLSGRVRWETKEAEDGAR